MTHTICIIHPFDPRGRKIGGIESHVREMIRSAPDDVDIFLVGIDEIGDLRLGEPQPLMFDGRKFSFLPLLRRTGEDHLRAARRLKDSLTLNFFLAFLAAVPKLRRALAGLQASAEIQRFEYATFGKLLGIPTVQLIHGEGSRDQPMDSLLKRYWFAHTLNEKLALRLATRIIGVNPRIVDRIRERFPFAAQKSAMMTVSVNTDVFALAEAYPPLQPFCIGFAGRLDAFKRPDIIFRVIEALSAKLDGKVEFHYIGGSNPEEFAEFDRVRAMTVLHGTQSSQGVAKILSQMHAGILVSEFEGMPVYVLELLAVGRPLVALELPQLNLVVEQNVSGVVVARTESADNNVSNMTAAFQNLKLSIAQSQFDPAAIRQKIEPFSHRVQKAKLLDIHRSIALGS
jgi:glycosyltransferase involved in cell wall biosynthesis